MERATFPAGTRLLKRREVAERVGCCERTLYRLIEQRQFPPPHKLTTKWHVWVEKQVDDWIRETLLAAPPDG